MKVLVIGQGGREHTLTWKLKQSKKVSKIFCAPGNGGMEKIATCIDIASDDNLKLLEFAKKENIDLVVVGPEQPLVNGIVDLFEENNILIFGPTKKASMLEGSKDFSKRICLQSDVLVAKGETFTNFENAVNYLKDQEFPIVIKADGLAAGKGVVIANSKSEAENALKMMLLDNKFGSSGSQVVIEEFLTGYEVSIFAICSNESTILLAPSQDHKRIFNDDKGPNTGGMGAYSPVPDFTETQKTYVKEKIILPVLKTMKNEGTPFSGLLYAGLMINAKSEIKVLEFNVRFGDPETQVVLPRLENDLFDILYAVAKKEDLSNMKTSWIDGFGVCVVAASKGYPGTYKKGFEIKGLNDKMLQSEIFHAGTEMKDEKIITSGGRVLCVSSNGKDLKEAKDKCYQSMSKINFEGIYYRTDIADKAI